LKQKPGLPAFMPVRALSEYTTLPDSILKINFCDMPNPVSFRYFKTSPEIIQKRGRPTS
jgi:hypothetical protein